MNLQFTYDTGQVRVAVWGTTVVWRVDGYLDTYGDEGRPAPFKSIAVRSLTSEVLYMNLGLYFHVYGSARQAHLTIA